MCYKQQKDILKKPPDKTTAACFYRSARGAPCGKGAWLCHRRAKNYLYTKIYVFYDETFGDEHKKLYHHLVLSYRNFPDFK